MKNQTTDKERETKLFQKRWPTCHGYADRVESRDLGRQVQHLLRELQERELGLNGDLTEDELRVMQEMNDAYEAGVDYTDTDKIISQRLIIFHNIFELQQQNQNLLRVTRQLGEKMEQDEREYQGKLENLESDALDKATQVINQLRDELKSNRMKMEAYIRERDMLRRKVSGHGTVTETQTTAPGSQPVVPTEEQNLLREVQAQFESYRNEAATDQRTLNNQIRSLTAESSQAQVNAAKYKSQMELANERYKILQGNMEMVKQESEDLRKRIGRMQEQQARQDVKVQQAAEELVDVRAFVESLRTENANLKAEKTLFRVQSPLHHGLR
jgi:nucleoprotein TPR